MTTGTATSLSVVVTASHGCQHADAVLEAVRSQMTPGDELIVVEPEACHMTPASQTERHVSVDCPDDFVMRIRGVAESTAERVLILEDHGVPVDGFLAALGDLFDREPDLQGANFFFANGTPEQASSRALYLFVCGDADAVGDRLLPRLVASTFALTGDALESARRRAHSADLAPGELEYGVCPGVVNRGLTALPRSLTVTHYQRNTLREAVSANYWNARHAGSVERESFATLTALRTIPRRYLGHVARLARDHPDARALLPQLTLIGSTACSGWWLGRYLGRGRSAEMLPRSHAHPAPVRSR